MNDSWHRIESKWKKNQYQMRFIERNGFTWIRNNRRTHLIEKTAGRQDFPVSFVFFFHFFLLLKWACTSQIALRHWTFEHFFFFFLPFMCFILFILSSPIALIFSSFLSLSPSFSFSYPLSIVRSDSVSRIYMKKMRWAVIRFSSHFLRFFYCQC